MIGVVHCIDSNGFYGAERVLLSLLKASESSKLFHTTLLNFLDRQIPTNSIGDRVRSLGLPILNFPNSRGFDLSALLRLSIIMLRGNAQIVHSHGYKPNIYLMILKPLLRNMIFISTVHGWAKESADGKLSLYEKLNSIALRSFDSCVAVSNAVKQDLLHTGLRSQSICVIPNGFDSPSPLLANNRHLEYSHQKAFLIGYAGRLVKEKGLDILIKAFHLFHSNQPASRLILAGDGPLKKDLQEMASSLNLSAVVTFVGFQENIFQFLDDLDLFVLPSRTEGLPMILLEAMHAQKPIIASSVGGIPEVIAPGIDGLLFQPGNHHHLSEMMQYLFENPIKASQLGTQARITVSTRFCVSSMCEAYERLYLSLIKRRFSKC